MKSTAIQLIQHLRNAGHTAYFAGGCVRDMLLKVEPKDYDIATDATPQQVQRLFPGSRLVGAHFGVVLVQRDGFQVEVATFRRDGLYTDGRHPDGVEFCSPEEDAQRRDFTVNGLFYDPLAEKLHDFVDGQADLERKVIRAIGDADQRFAEDHLRMLRAIRFATNLQFEIEDATWQSIQKHASSLTKISAERIREEFGKVMLSPQRVRGFDLLVESGLMHYIMPDILKLKGCEQPPEFHPEGDVFVHTRLLLVNLKELVTLPLVLAVLLHDIAKPDTQTVDENGRIRFNGHDMVGADKSARILRDLRYSNDIVEDVSEMVRQHMVFKDIPHMRNATIKRFMARPTFEQEIELHRVDCLSSHGSLSNLDIIEQKRAEFAREPLIPPPLVTGRDLMEIGWKPGPELGAFLREIQTMQLDGALTNKEEALNFVRQRAGSDGF